jgi:hypothetical protein
MKIILYFQTFKYNLVYKELTLRTSVGVYNGRTQVQQCKFTLVNIQSV